MLPRKRRIERKDFTLIPSGKRLSTAIFSLNLVKMDNLNPSRFSFSVSKKVTKKATIRNKLRRRGYSVIEKIIDRINPGFYLFFAFKSGSSVKTYKEIEKEVLELLSKSFVLK